MERNSIIRIGIMVVISIIILVWGLSFLKGDNLFKTENEYYAIYDKIDGLMESNEVQFSGYKIGSVSEVNHFSDSTIHFGVKIRINNDFKIPVGSVAKITSLDIMGSKGVEIIMPERITGYLENGDTILSNSDAGLIEQVMSMVMPMKDQFISFLQSTDSVMYSVNQLLNEQNRTNLGKSLSDLQVLTTHLRNNANSIDTMMSNMRQLSTTLGNNSANIDRAINNFATMSDSLRAADIAKTIREARTALDNVNVMLRQVNDGDGSVSKIMKSDSLYNNLERASTTLDRVLADFEKHPKKYINLAVFGGKDKSEKKKNRE